MFWKESFLNKMRQTWADEIEKFQYKATGIWHDFKINLKAVESDNVKIIALIDSNDSFAITGVRALDKDNNVIGEIAENVIKAAGSQMLSEWKFSLVER